MAQFPPTNIEGGIETGRLGGHVRGGTPAAHRKAFTQSARESMRDINTRYTNIVRQMQGITPRVLREAMLPAFEKAVVYCPFLTGALRASGRLEVERSTKNRARATITFGSPTVRYAPIVHERTDLHHVPPTRAKFLQSAMEEEMGSFLTRLAIFYATVLK